MRIFAYFAAGPWPKAGNDIDSRSLIIRRLGGHKSRSPIMKALFALLFLFSQIPAQAAGLSQNAGLRSHEAERVELRDHAQDEIEFLDNATPDEIQSQFELVPEVQSVVPSSPAAGYGVQIDVSISRQSLTIRYPGGRYNTAVSTGRAGYPTRTGCYSAPRLEKMHYSSKYENAPMPHSMFYYGGFAIHGTYDEAHLGRPASHGCVRVSLQDAAYLFSIVREFGSRNARICVR